MPWSLRSFLNTPSLVKPSLSTARWLLSFLSSTLIWTLIIFKVSKQNSSSRNLLSERSEEHTSELQSRFDLVCRLLLEKKKKTHKDTVIEIRQHQSKDLTNENVLI